MSVKTEKIRKRYNRASSFYDLMENPMEIMAMKKWRIELMKELKGRVLEVGVGTGKNIPYYPEDVDITAIDFSEKMLAKAKQKADTFSKKVSFFNMDAEHMDFDDNSFDMVFTTCVFCSVPDPVQGLREIRRVCKPGGRIIMIEHVRSEGRLLGLLMDILNPVVVGAYGANINRRTVENIRLAGFEDIEVTNLFKDIVKRIVIKNSK